METFSIMISELLSINHQKQLQQQLRSIETHLSEYSFSNLYLFRKEHNYHLIKEYNEQFIQGITYDNVEYIMPIQSLEKIDTTIIDPLLKKYNMFFPIPEEWLDYIEKDKYDISYNDGDSDYIHSIEKIESYKGKKLHKKRNLLKQFIEQYDHTYKPIDNTNTDDCFNILEQWLLDVNLSKDEGDYNACMEGLQMMDTLHLNGAVYYVSGQPAGFILGEEIHDSHYSIHFAKAKREYKGVYQFIFNHYAKLMPAKYCCFNFQQDLGLDSLRQAKASYKPEAIVKKYRIKLKNS